MLEQRGDEGGIVWPREVAPYDVEVVSLDAGSAELAGTSERIAAELDAAGRAVLLDDRDQRPGEKFADADLFGAPLRVVVGKKTAEDGAVDVRDRTSGEETRVARLDLAKWVVGR